MVVFCFSFLFPTLVLKVTGYTFCLQVNKTFLMQRYVRLLLFLVYCGSGNGREERKLITYLKIKINERFQIQCNKLFIFLKQFKPKENQEYKTCKT